MKLDNTETERATKAAAEEATVDRLLEGRMLTAPDNLAANVMQQLPDRAPRAAVFPFPHVMLTHPRWMPVTLAAAAALLIAVGLWLPMERKGDETVRIIFELHAPEAGKVELVGSFNQWQVGAIVLQGPDASGHWTTTVELPRGRHEYCFLVDGNQWIADPNAITRPDGFGRENALLEI